MTMDGSILRTHEYRRCGSHAAGGGTQIDGRTTMKMTY
jgi:hypothetical protein